MMISNSVKQWFIQINLFCIFILQTIISCEKLNARISLKVQGIGFHRDLIYQIHVDQFIEECYIAIYLQLPSALYTNINELIHLRRFNINTICVHEKTDIELFAEKAQIQNVIICSSLTRVGCALKLPIHQRYQYANDSDKYMNITLPDPILLLGCRKKIEGYRVSKLDLCSPCVTIVPKWREIPYVTDKKDLWTVPVGETTMLCVVTYTTCLLTMLCTIYLIRTVWKSIPKQHLKHE